MASHSANVPDAVREASRVVVLGAGHAGRAAARAASEAGAHVLLADKGEAIAGAFPPTVTKAPGTFAVDLAFDEGALVGAILLDGGQLRVVRASAVVLATGGVEGLFFPGWETGDGLALAARAGAALTGLDRLALDRAAKRAVLGGGLVVHDAITSIERLFAAGEVAAWPDLPTPAEAVERSEADGRAAGARAAAARGRPPGPGRLQMRPSIDSPLPPGFVDVKMDRLRKVLLDGIDEPEKAIPHVLRLKGEADDFARARPQPELYAFQNACEVAMLLLKARRG